MTLDTAAELMAIFSGGHLDAPTARKLVGHRYLATLATGLDDCWTRSSTARSARAARAKRPQSRPPTLPPASPPPRSGQ